MSGRISVPAAVAYADVCLSLTGVPTVTVIGGRPYCRARFVMLDHRFEKWNR